jgi:hypothetical protein
VREGKWYHRVWFVTEAAASVSPNSLEEVMPAMCAKSCCGGVKKEEKKEEKKVEEKKGCCGGKK